MTEQAPEARLQALGIELPSVPTPIANFVPYQRSGQLLLLAGQTCELNGEMIYRGKVGQDHDIKTGQKAARICALNLLAALRQAYGGKLISGTRCMRLGGFVNCTPNFDKVPAVVNGASDLICEIFGDEDLHARTAVGVVTLPQNATVEVDGIFELP